MQFSFIFLNSFFYYDFFQRWIMKHFGILLMKQLEVFFWAELRSLFTPMVPSLVMLSLIIKMRSLQLKKGTIHILRNHCGVGQKTTIFACFQLQRKSPLLQCNRWILLQTSWHLLGHGSHQFLEDTVTLLPYYNHREEGGGGAGYPMGPFIVKDSALFGIWTIRLQYPKFDALFLNCYG